MLRQPLLLLLALAAAGCDRSGLPEEEPEEMAPGTFVARVEQVGGGGFEELQGTAVVDVEPTVKVRLAVPIADGASRVDLLVEGPRPDDAALPGPGVYRIGDATVEDPAAALCYRSPVFADGPYRSESGSLTVTGVSAETLDAEFEAVGALDLATGPDTSVRVRVELSGRFRARPGQVGDSAGSIRRCDP